MLKDLTNIFIIDDNKIFALTLRAELEKIVTEQPFEISLFESGEACKSMLHRQPDLVIVDYHLDGLNSQAMNGIEVIKMIRRECPETDFIMITMDEKTELFLRSKEEGIYDYFTKGVHLPFKLSLSMQQWLKWKNNT